MFIREDSWQEKTNFGSAEIGEIRAHRIERVKVQAETHCLQENRFLYSSFNFKVTTSGRWSDASSFSWSIVRALIPLRLQAFFTENDSNI